MAVPIDKYVIQVEWLSNYYLRFLLGLFLQLRFVHRLLKLHVLCGSPHRLLV